MAVGNPFGAVCLYDGENPRTFTGMAREVISGGQFVFVSGADGTAQVGSHANSFKTTDLEMAVCAAIGFCNGVALNNAASGAEVTVATRGIFLIKAAGSISGGTLVTNNGRGDAVSPAGLTSTGSWTGLVGRSLTNAGSEAYCAVSIGGLF